MSVRVFSAARQSERMEVKSLLIPVRSCLTGYNQSAVIR